MSEPAPAHQPPRPVALPVSPEVIPAELKALDQWVTWRYAWLSDRKHWDKPPLQARTVSLASSTDPRTWTTFEETLDVY
jgi:primase-polymerase (primpol)-like protein